jgi:hypothetical protein
MESPTDCGLGEQEVDVEVPTEIVLQPGKARFTIPDELGLMIVQALVDTPGVIPLDTSGHRVINRAHGEGEARKARLTQIRKAKADATASEQTGVDKRKVPAEPPNPEGGKAEGKRGAPR